MNTKYYMIEYENMSTGLIVKASSKKEAIKLYVEKYNMMSLIEKDTYSIFSPTFELTERQAKRLIGTIRGGVTVSFSTNA